MKFCHRKKVGNQSDRNNSQEQIEIIKNSVKNFNLKNYKNNMNNINKNMQKIFKSFSYSIFSLIHGKIKGVISPNNDSRLKIFKSKLEDNIQYNVYRIKNARLYTDRIQDTAIILDNKIVEGPSHQLRPINNSNIKQNIVFTKGTPRIKKKLKVRFYLC